jgi:hypothetical protein
VSGCEVCDGDGWVEKWVENGDEEYPIALPCPAGCDARDARLSAANEPAEGAER